MDRPKTTPKDFFLWAGAMAALYVGVFHYIALVWDYINYAIPDPLQYYPADPYQSGIPWEMSTLIVLTPLFLILMWLIRRDIRMDASRRDLWVRRWVLFLTLFLAGITIAVDLIWVFNAFLNGTDLTTRFLLKALVVLLVAAVGFMHFLADLWNYWEKYPFRNRLVAIGTGLLVAITIIAGFFIVGTPAQARLYRFDAQKVTDLQSIQGQVVYYWQAKQKLPASLTDLTDTISGFRAPTDPQTGEAYTYRLTGASAMAFELCANFNAPSRTQEQAAAVPVVPGEKVGVQESWQHAAGTVCFERAIDPDRYPPIKRP